MYEAREAMTEAEFKKMAVIDELIEKGNVVKGSKTLMVEKTVKHKVTDFGALAHRVISEIVKIQNIIMIKEGIDPMDKNEKALFIRGIVTQYKMELEG